MLWDATHSTLPSEATTFSRPHCISFGSWHCSSTCVRVRVRVRARINPRTREGRRGQRLYGGTTSWGEGYGATPVGVGCGVGWARVVSSRVEWPLHVTNGSRGAAHGGREHQLLERAVSLARGGRSA